MRPHKLICDELVLNYMPLTTGERGRTLHQDLRHLSNEPMLDMVISKVRF